MISMTRRLAVGACWCALAVLLMGADCTDDRLDGLTGPVNQTPQTSRYGALGNSLTAGFINGGLIAGGQNSSYPALIAAQAGYASLEMPLVAAPGLGSSGSALFVDATGAITSLPNPVNPLVLLRNATLPVPYDNLAIPGATALDLLNATSSATSQSGANPFFDLILRNTALPPGDATALSAMTARNPNILTLWIGSNDVLSGATGGDPVVGVNITPPAIFAGIYASVLDAVDAMNAETVAIANVPTVTQIPFVRTVPLGTDVPGVGFVRWQMDEDTTEDPVQFVTLSAPVINPAVAPQYLPPNLGGTLSLPSSVTLTQSEVALIESTTEAFNATIDAAVQARGWALVDAATALAALPADPTNPATFGQPNAIFGWIPNPQTGTLFQNGLSAFSLDGVHPSEVGQGLIANAFIDALNSNYGLSIPSVDVGSLQNTVGFEKAPLGRPAAVLGASTLFTEEGQAALQDMLELFTAQVGVGAGL